MRRVHPLLSPFGLIFTFVIFLGLGFTYVRQGGLMFSPGELTEKSRSEITLQGFDSHAEFETECHLCHDPVQSLQGDLCIKCHVDVSNQIESQAGTHAKFDQVIRCFACHADHQGRDFDPTMDALSFYDHNLAHFSLLQHQVDYFDETVDCTTCHNFENGFTFLRDSCATCHANYDFRFMERHLMDFDSDCLICHDGLDSVAQFDHVTSSYPLVGEHLQIACVECHQEGRFLDTPQDCVSCHDEPEIHMNLFSQDCASCHTSQEWNLVIWEGQIFNHLLISEFSLQSHHSDFSGTQIRCAACHLPQEGEQLSFDLNSCTNCHITDNSEFMVEHQQEYGSACVTCHDGTGRMADFDHNLTFTLNGRHAEVLCESCHIEQLYQGTPRECVTCHLEPEIHLGVFGLSCESCHSTQAWSPANLTSHTFPLDHGDQGMVACETCHVASYVEYTCYGCHDHQPGEIQSEHQEEGVSSIELVDCVACHPNGLEDEAEND